MAATIYIKCPHCKASYGPCQWTFRKESGPIVVSCYQCNRHISLDKLCLEWELLTKEQQALRYLSTGISAIVNGLCYSLAAVAIVGILVLWLIKFPAKAPIPVGSPYVVFPYLTLSVLLAGWFFRRMIRQDIEGSSRRLADPEYKAMLRKCGKLPRIDA